MFSGKYLFTILTAALWISSSRGQVRSPATESEKQWRLNGDTLYLGSGQKVYVGEILIVGKGSGTNGWFHTIGFKSEFSWPVWFMRDTESKYNYDYQTHPQKRVNDKVRGYLRQSDTLRIKTLQKEGNKRSGYWVTAVLTSYNHRTIKFRSNIMESIVQKELIAY